jgi:hypothetical protein
VVQCDCRTGSGKNWTTVQDYGAGDRRRRESVTDISETTTTAADFLRDGQNVVRSFRSRAASKNKG